MKVEHTSTQVKMRCPLCRELYDETEHRPKVLPCGHTYCLVCVEQATFGANCPEDNKAFVGSAANLPDNLQVLGEASLSRPRFWCRNCNSELVEDCVDAGHRPWTVRQMRTELVDPMLDQLDRAKAHAREVADRVLLASGAFDGMATTWESCYNLLVSGHSHLERLAAGEMEAPTLKQALDNTEGLVEKVPTIEQCALLLEARGSLDMTLTEETGRKRSVSVALADDEDSKLMRVVLLKFFTKMQEVANPVQQIPSPAMSPVHRVEGDECDVSDLCKSSPSVLSAALEDPSFGTVRHLKGLRCSSQPRWGVLLLHRLAPHLESLEMTDAAKAHLEEVAAMRSLRELDLASVEELTFAPDLPLQLRRLRVVRASMRQLACAQSMPGLRDLELHTASNGPWVVPKLEPGFGGLTRLCVTMSSMPTLVALLKTHVRTLELLEIACSVKCQDHPFWFPYLGEILYNLRFQALRQVVLLRSTPLLDNAAHNVDLCQDQVQDITRLLTKREVPEGSLSVRVLCSECDRLEPSS